jgi:replicative DNA helicase
MAVDDLLREAPPGGVPPQNTDAEESVLGAALIDREAIGRVAAFLRSEDFYRERNGAIYDAMLALYDRHEPVDYMTLSDELGRRGQLEQVGGIIYLGRLLEIVPTSLHIEEYGHIVERTALMRRLISAGGKIAALGYADAFDIDTTLEKAEQLLLGVSSKRVTRDFQSLSEVLRQYFEQLEQLQEGDRMRYGVPTGFIDLDRLTGGLQRSDLVILAARPSMGKTSLAMNIGANAALKYRAIVGLFSLEMSKGQLAARLLSTESGVDSSRLRAGARLSDTEHRKLALAHDVLSEAPVYVDDTPGISIMELRSKARRLHADAGVDLIIVDYLQLIAGSRTENRVQEISEISRSLKSLARELHVPVLALSQLSRAVESRSPHIPMLSDLRESGTIEQDADVVMFIYREDAYNKDTEKKGIVELHVAKHRNGPVGQVSLLFNERTTKFVDLEPFRE